MLNLFLSHVWPVMCLQWQHSCEKIANHTWCKKYSSTICLPKIYQVLTHLLSSTFTPTLHHWWLHKCRFCVSCETTVSHSVVHTTLDLQCMSVCQFWNVALDFFSFSPSAVFWVTGFFMCALFDRIDLPIYASPHYGHELQRKVNQSISEAQGCGLYCI